LLMLLCLSAAALPYLWLLMSAWHHPQPFSVTSRLQLAKACTVMPESHSASVSAAGMCLFIACLTNSTSLACVPCILSLVVLLAAAASCVAKTPPYLVEVPVKGILIVHHSGDEAQHQAPAAA
jgi:hypothetical protein